MPRNPENQVVGMAYQSDDLNTYTVGVRRNHFEAIGGVLATGQPPYPRGWKVRHIGLLGDDGVQRAKLVVPNAVMAQFTEEAVTVTIPGLGSFSKTGSSGEKRPHKYLNS